MKIFLDYGHGGLDSGAKGNGLVEKDLNLKIGKLIANDLKSNYENVEILESRSNDTYLTLDARTNKANEWKADIFLSIHINASPLESPKGFESHVYKLPSAKTQSFQNVLHAEIMKQIGDVKGVEDRGKKQSNFHVLRESKMASVLTENFFVTNPGDASLLKSDTFLIKLALGHVLGLERFLGLKRKDIKSTPNIPPTIKAAEDDLVTYQVIVGSFKDKDNADRLALKLKDQGYNPYIKKV
jgi:N-acetylmuramoyl-L-alanine amidase